MTTMQQSRAWQGATLFSFGFRPFFLAGALYAGLVVATWVPWYLGQIDVPTAFAPLTWHAHELLFGYGFAVIAGFLLTAVPNWTGRLPVVGYPLMALFALWLLGRVAVAVSATLEPIVLAGLSLAFPVALVIVMAREVVVGGNTKNMIVIAAVSVLAFAQALTQYEHWSETSDPVGARVGIAAIVTLIMIIGGRVTPSFTRNWLRKSNPGREPRSISRLDFAAVLLGALCLLLWSVAPLLPEAAQPWLGWLLISAGVMHLIRQALWAPDRTLTEPIVAVLHLGYFFVPTGFLLTGGALTEQIDIPELAGLHAWSAGAVGIMTLAVMTRATLGHTGREIKASPGTLLIYSAVVAAALTRIIASLVPEFTRALLELSAVCWCLAFFGFAMVYGPMLLSRRV